jgi:hypothetical protein
LVGLPEMCDYHLMNNKRYLLVKTKDPETAELWELETGRCLHKFSEPFNQVKDRLSKYDQ